jgi:hypothetical protein
MLAGEGIFTFVPPVDPEGLYNTQSILHEIQFHELVLSWLEFDSVTHVHRACTYAKYLTNNRIVLWFEKRAKHAYRRKAAGIEAVGGTAATGSPEVIKG